MNKMSSFINSCHVLPDPVYIYINCVILWNIYIMSILSPKIIFVVAGKQKYKQMCTLFIMPVKHLYNV